MQKSQFEELQDARANPNESTSCLMVETGTKKEHGRNVSRSLPERLDKSWLSEKTNM